MMAPYERPEIQVLDPLPAGRLCEDPGSVNDLLGTVDNDWDYDPPQ